jgi:predicted phosphohydrolase
MRFWVTSDLHYGRKRGDAATRALAAHVAANPADALVIVGDLGNGRDAICDCLQLFARVPGPKFAVPGNHDVWTQGWETDDSWTLHETQLPALFSDAGFASLHLEPAIVGDVALVGSMGWYDYSFRDPIDVPLASYESKIPPWSERAIWMDAHYAHFGVDDPALTLQLADRLSAHLSAVDAPRIVAFVHHLIDKALLVHPRVVVPFKWRWANTFLGANLFGQRLAADGRVASAFCGHIHMERRAKVGAFPARCIGSDYKRKQLLLVEPGRVIETHLFEG